MIAIADASIAILWAATAYLFALGVAVIVRPALARHFLFGFAQTTGANVLEATLRLIVGLAFVGAAAETRSQSVSLGIGWFLVITALLMILLSRQHRRFAASATRSVSRLFPLFGMASLLLAVALLWFIS